MEIHPIIIAGAGPGAPDLITVRCQKALEQADFILYAGSLAPESILSWARPGAVRQNSASMHLDQIVDAMVDARNQGKRVVRLHSGDPALYGAIGEQMARLDALGVPYEIIPGVTAAFAASAALKTEYTVPEKSQTLIFTRMSGRTPVPQKEALAGLASHKASMAIYLSASMAGEAARTLAAAYGSKAPCVAAYKVSHPGENIVHTTLDQLARVMEENGMTRHTLILVGPFLEGESNAESLLYNKNFSHGCRG